MVTLSIFLIIVAQLLFGAPFSSPVDQQARITTSRLIRDCPVVVALTTVIQFVQKLTLLGLGLIKINTVLANFNNPRPSLTLNN